MLADPLAIWGCADSAHCSSEPPPGGLEMLLFALVRSREPRQAVDVDAAKTGIRL
jgi:hypothetical protein